MSKEKLEFQRFLYNIFQWKIKVFVLGIINYSYYKKLSNKPPIIICGCGRSGTTLLLSIISAHKKVHGINRESGCLANPKLVKRSLWWTKLNISYELFLDRKVSADRWAEKTPKNINNLPMIFDFFNNKVKVVHIVRDGRDVVLSKHPSNKQTYWVSINRWVNDVKSGLKYINKSNVHTLKYEDLILKHKETIEQLFLFLELPLTNEVLDFTNHTNVKKNNAWENEVETISTNSIKKWQNIENDSIIEQLYANKQAVELLNTLGYENTSSYSR